MRVFAFVKDEELSSFVDDLKAFFQQQSEEWRVKSEDKDNDKRQILKQVQNDKQKQRRHPELVSGSVVHSTLHSPLSTLSVLAFPSDDAQQRAFAIDAVKNKKNFILCATDISINSPVSAPSADTGMVLKPGQRHNFNELVTSLVAFGYNRINFVEDRLQFAVRGDIIDIWPAAGDAPVRVLFEFETIEAIRIFDSGSQLSNAFIDEVKILPVNPSGDTATIKDYFQQQSEEWRVRSGDTTTAIPHSTLRVALSRKGRGNNKAVHPSPLAGEGARSAGEGYAVIFTPHSPLSTLLFFDYPLSKEEEEAYSKHELVINNPLNKNAQYQGYKSFAGFQGDTKYFVNSLKNFAQSGAEIKIYCANSGEQERISDILYDAGGISLPHPSVIPESCYPESAVNTGLPRRDSVSSRNDEYDNPPQFLYGNLSQGFFLEKGGNAPGDEVPEVFVSSREMLYKKKPVSFPKVKGGRRLEGIWEISAGDYVVHEKYGIGRYVGLKTISREDRTSEYLCIEYRSGDKLYVPPEEIKTVKKYIGVEGVKPKLYSMDTGAWERVKSRAREAAAEFAKELLKLYAERSKVKRTPLSCETPWEKELEDAFPYEETPDQLKAIEDVKSDFLKPYPMERLICGDVGYGKTEVAVRAAFKAVQDGMQAAVLVPTTVLAQQHFNTFHERLSPFPTRVEVLSRFQSKANQKKIIKELEEGKIDIIVGTHRLLQKDIKFKNLGILIVDEEHRFGVRQKEKIKAFKKNIDILMLSATPIPRTLSSALSGFRDLSVIETPPFGRLPIETTLSAYDEKMVKTIIEAELSRGGQVFYVYNRVETIQTKAAEIRKLVPDVKLGVIHGQMHAGDIENVMWKFVNFELDMLLATTIIESGLDIPSVNTMIVEEAENFGLSQLYQLRGRIGREKQKAYCYLFYKDEKLSDEAIKRLEAMKEFSELGSGFRLALKDLEIRGAGGILSASQHGFVRDIGYDMFSKLLEEEGKKVKGETFAPEAGSNSEIDLQVSALIPQSYIEDDDIRILFYRKLSDAKDSRAVEKVQAELADRFGKIPQETQKLFEITKLRLEAEKLHIERIAEDNNYIYVYFSQTADFSKADIPKLITDYAKMIEFISGRDNVSRGNAPGNTSSYAFKLRKSGITGETPEFVRAFLGKLGFYLKV
ncbi:MAG: transcription-repair coupling factor [Endomicrobia bacterium]|nr:transcription-repair coupling factor [Endomicrobiia bacterium]